MMDPCPAADGEIMKSTCVNPKKRSPATSTPSPSPTTSTPPPEPSSTPAEAAAQAWSTQPFAQAKPSIQPVGGVTLPGLKTYFQATFGEHGMAPGEEETVTLLGQTVTVRPRAVTYTYYFGDGSSTGPTSNRGGPYPHGTITHTYTKTGKVTVRVDMTLSGEFRQGNGAWQPIAGTTTVRGTDMQLDVRALQSRLVH